MENCLVTKLKGVVDNTNLKKLGVFTVEVTGATSAELFTMRPYQGSTITFKDLTNTFSDGTTEKTITRDSDGVLLAAGNHKIEVSPKYNIDTLALNNAKYAFDVEDLYAGNNYTIFNFENSNAVGNIVKILTAYTTRIQLNNTDVELNLNSVRICTQLQVVTGSRKTAGDIIVFSNLTSLTTVALQNNTHITGNIKSFGACTNLTRLNVGGSSLIEGTVEDFVAMQNISGRASYNAGTNFGFYNTKIKFNDAYIYFEKSLSWEASGENTVITYGEDSTTIHVNSDGTWTRVS